MWVITTNLLDGLMARVILTSSKQKSYGFTLFTAAIPKFYWLETDENYIMIRKLTKKSKTIITMFLTYALFVKYLTFNEIQWGDITGVFVRLTFGLH